MSRSPSRERSRAGVGAGTWKVRVRETDSPKRNAGTPQAASWLVTRSAPVSGSLRIVTASRADIGRAVADSRLREDLYYLLNVVPLAVPPLRDHREDIPELVSYYIDVLVTRENLPNRRLTVGAQNRLRNHSWPGNVRELINVLQRLLILGSGSVIELEAVEATLGATAEFERREDEILEFEVPFREAREQFERAYLEYRLRKAGGSVSKVATAAGIERTHLYRKLRGLGIDPKSSAVLSPRGGD